MSLLMRWPILVLFLSCSIQAQDPQVDIRYVGTVLRNANGTIARNPSVTAAFRAAWKCPATGLFTGPCKGWKMDHVIPLSCGGVDAVWNLQWLPTPAAKDKFERRVYGGNAISKGCP